MSLRDFIYSQSEINQDACHQELLHTSNLGISNSFVSAELDYSQLFSQPLQAPPPLESTVSIAANPGVGAYSADEYLTEIDATLEKRRFAATKRFYF